MKCNNLVLDWFSKFFLKKKKEMKEILKNENKVTIKKLRKCILEKYRLDVLFE